MSRITRRTFARNAFVVATAAVVLPTAIAQTETPPPAPTPPLSASSQAEVEARINWIFTKYGARLNEQQRADIRRVITNGQAGIEAMRAYPLGNANAPAEPFRIYRRAK